MEQTPNQPITDETQSTTEKKHTKLSLFLAQEKEKLKDMTPKQKKEYLWEYYRYHALIAIIILILIPVIGNIIYQNTFSTRFYCVIVNDMKNEAAIQTIEKDFVPTLKLSKKEKVAFDSSLQFDPEADDQYNSAAYSKFNLLLNQRQADVMLADKSIFDYFQGQDIFYNLEDFLSAEDIKAYENYFIYGTNSKGEKLPMGIDMSNTKFCKETNLKSTYLLFPVSSHHKEDALNFLHWITK